MSLGELCHLSYAHRAGVRSVSRVFKVYCYTGLRKCNRVLTPYCMLVKQGLLHVARNRWCSVLCGKLEQDLIKEKETAASYLYFVIVLLMNLN